LLFAATPAIAGAPQPSELFAKAATIKVYMYEADEKKLPAGVMLDFRTLDSTAAPDTGITLDAKQAERVKRAFSKPTGDQAIGACFVPRHGFVFEDAQGQVIGTLDVCFECTNYSIKAPGYDEKVKPIYETYAKRGDWNEKLQRQQTAEVDKVRVAFDMPPTDAPVDWKGLAALVTELGLPPQPKPDDYARLRPASNSPCRQPSASPLWGGQRERREAPLERVGVGVTPRTPTHSNSLRSFSLASPQGGGGWCACSSSPRSHSRPPPPTPPNASAP
jgi:hypothetical protein